MKVISRKNLPVRIPINRTLIVVLLCLQHTVPSWIKFTLVLILILHWSIVFAILIHEKETHLFETESEEDI